MKELQALEEAHPEFADPHSPTQRVGSDLSKEFEQVVHQYPMLSLGNTYSEEEIRDFYERTERALNEPFEIVAELKYCCFNVPEAALRGLAKSGSSCSSRSLFRRSNSAR